MTIVADHPRTVQHLEGTVAVDTHADFHVATVIDPLGRHLGHETFPTTPAGYRALIGWLRSHGTVIQVGVEGTGAYGAGLARAMRVAEPIVVEVDRPDRTTRRDHGKTDPIDATLQPAPTRQAGRRALPRPAPATSNRSALYASLASRDPSQSQMLLFHVKQWMGPSVIAGCTSIVLGWRRPFVISS